MDFYFCQWAWIWVTWLLATIVRCVLSGYSHSSSAPLPSSPVQSCTPATQNTAFSFPYPSSGAASWVHRHRIAGRRLCLRNWGWFWYCYRLGWVSWDCRRTIWSERFILSVWTAGESERTSTRLIYWCFFLECQCSESFDATQPPRRAVWCPH